MSQPPPTPVFAPTPDPLTPDRDITHQHFQAGDTVVVLKGVAGGELWGDAMRVVAPSWHTPTDVDGWRLRDATGGAQSYITAHPRYLVHLSRRCPDCLIHLRAMEDALLPKYTDDNALIDCGWYTTTALNQLVHIADARSSR
ncbi:MULTISPECIES: hypothetical protein [Streptomyces]|uniref:hypothetical protein n=1 Tax=Streptomyces TaxID=1883 RepID=UPI0004C4C5AE|nr:MULTISPECIES: hypothetical protein [unclassified Streptomyces]MBT2363912.1 hypothetical protein [Streptomyces sp. ISL-10]RST08108.1 hypothetical protein EF905_30790 [Streptomyces sp. WAC05374]TDF43889.1 hypothetical protein E2B92_18240 [Streptomyces sp. WAC05374]TDF51944.1 hypothetical protein E2C00_24530 [Streptomyces sp. WAC05374]TDF54299.1 hypothetical protein E2C02_16925 [Streptomyces sp. WAC05374]